MTKQFCSIRFGMLLPELLFLLTLFFLFPAPCSADFTFTDTRFQGIYTTANLDRIIDAYHLYDGWFWSTRAFTDQTFHGLPDQPGWTDSSSARRDWGKFFPEYFGCRWGVDQVSKYTPAGGGYGECFGFAQFIGYLLSGDINPQGHWPCYYSIEKAGGLKVGDIVRVEYTLEEQVYQHSAVVYAVYGEEIRFLSVNSSDFNCICVDCGFSDGRYMNVSLLQEIAKLPWMKISRAPDNL